MKCFKEFKSLVRGDVTILVWKGEEEPPEGTPAHFMTTDQWLHTCSWLREWRRITEKEGALSFLKYGTFNTNLIDNFKGKLHEMKPPPRPNQYEAFNAMG